MKKNSDKKMFFEMMHKVGGMPLNENYPMGAEPEYAGDDAPYNEPENDENNEPDPDEYRDDDVDEGWGKNLAAGAMMTAASLGGMSGAQAQQTAANEPVKQGIENVDNN